jgi:hypothetical protein
MIRTTRHRPVISDLARNARELAATKMIMELQADDDRSIESQWRVGLPRLAERQSGTRRLAIWRPWKGSQMMSKFHSTFCVGAFAVGLLSPAMVSANPSDESHRS